MNIEQQALAIIESYCGQSFTARQVNERIPLKQNIGRLTHEPVVRIDAIQARSSVWEYASVFGTTEWIDIPLHDAYLTDKNVMVISGGFLDVHYTEADVSYTVGFEKLPVPIQSALDKLIRLLGSGAKSSYSMAAFITPEIVELLAPYNLYTGGAKS